MVYVPGDGMQAPLHRDTHTQPRIKTEARGRAVGTKSPAYLAGPEVPGQCIQSTLTEPRSQVGSPDPGTQGLPESKVG